MTFNLSNKNNHLWNDMITVLNANFAQVSTTQIECMCKMNCQTQPKTNIGKCEEKRHKVMPTMQQTKRNNRIERDLLKGYKLRTNYVKNTTSHKSRPLNIQTKIRIT